MATPIKILLFEDTLTTRSDVLEALKTNLTEQAGSVIPFAAGQFEEAAEQRQQMYEARLESILTNPPYSSATLIVADRDLSKSQDAGFAGLSVNAVASVARKLAIPLCSYARQPNVDDYDWRGRWEEGHIVVKFADGVAELARRAVVAARGFAEIAEGLPVVLADKTRNSSAKILASLLGKPEYAEKIALYSVGDQSRLSEILAKPKQAEQKMGHFLGYWLWDSLLRYPGLLVNEVAAGSYLNIGIDDFREPSVRLLFDQAIYRGPFADTKKPQWWRGMLDDIVSHEDCNDGLEFARKKAKPTAVGSQCCVDPSKPAGYYCIISQKPVSLQNSKGGLSWFPRGADLTRISLPMLEEYGPWLGA
jgi:hypothetical protein